MSITISAALKAHLSQSDQTTCTLWLVTLVDSTVLGFTDHNNDVSFNGVTFQAATGYTRADIASADDLSVDNTELDGMIRSPSITDDALREGVWDHASVKISLVNYRDLSMGELIVREGTLGEVTLERNTYKAEIRGKAQFYARTLGELTQAGCRANLGDSRCKVNMAGTSAGSPGLPLTVTSTLTGVNADKITMYDSARMEPGPTGGIAITNVTNGNPGVVTVADGSGFFNMESVTLAGIVGMPLLNSTTLIRNLSGNSFDLGIDTSDTLVYGTYVSGGTVTPMGGDSGFFDNGVMTMNNGPAAGFSMEVFSYVPGQWILALPFAGGVLTPVTGNSYTMKAGCDKSLSTCIDKFNNAVNMRAEPYLPGYDKIVQVGKQG